MALILGAARKTALRDREIRRGEWNDLPISDLRGKTLGLIGFGRIAQLVVPLAKAFGMKVTVWTRNPKQSLASEHGIKFVELKELMSSSNVISIHLHLNKETEGLLSSEMLHLTQPDSIIVNTAREQLLDEPSLIELLKSGHLAAMATDVFNEEPLPPSHPFLKMDNVLMTPHNAYNTSNATAEMCDVAIDNLLSYFSGEPKNVASE
jgi:D-3-phosphoglycerate dehydrogenase / 2-oxoglutarate reductase